MLIILAYSTRRLMCLLSSLGPDFKSSNSINSLSESVRCAVRRETSNPDWHQNFLAVMPGFFAIDTRARIVYSVNFSGISPFLAIIRFFFASNSFLLQFPSSLCS